MPSKSSNKAKNQRSREKALLQKVHLNAAGIDMQSKSAIGAFIRRIKSRVGAPTAINAGAHKLARLVYRMLKFGKAYVETGQEAYEKSFQERTLRNLQRKAHQLGFKVIPITTPTVLVS